MIAGVTDSPYNSPNSKWGIYYRGNVYTYMFVYAACRPPRPTPCHTRPRSNPPRFLIAVSTRPPLRTREEASQREREISSQGTNNTCDRSKSSLSTDLMIDLTASTSSQVVPRGFEHGFEEKESRVNPRYTSISTLPFCSLLFLFPSSSFSFLFFFTVEIYQSQKLLRNFTRIPG